MIRLLVAFLLLSCAAFSATTTISDTVTNADGSPASGQIIIMPTSKFTTSSGAFVSQTPTVVKLVNGTFVVALEANEGTTPATAYSITYVLTTTPRTAPRTDMWFVPTSTQALSIADVESAYVDHSTTDAALSSVVAKFADATNIGNKDVDNTHLSYLKNVTSDIQAQLDAKGSSSPGGSSNAIQYNGGANLSGVINSTGTKKFLSQTAGLPPTLDTLSGADIPAIDLSVVGQGGVKNTLPYSLLSSIPPDLTAAVSAWTNANSANGALKLDSNALIPLPQIPTGIHSSSINYAQNSVYFPRSIPTKMLDLPVSPQDYIASTCGAVDIADGNSHPLSGCFATLADAQAVYPFATALTDELAWAATMQALASSSNILVPKGTYLVNETINVTGKYGFTFRGINWAQIKAGRGGTNFVWTGAQDGQVFLWDQVQFATVERFTVDGNLTAGIGMQFGNPNGEATSTFHNQVSLISILNCLGSPGRGLFVGQDGFSRDISQSTFKQLFLSNNVVNLYQAGDQTLKNIYTDNVFNHGTISTTTQYGIYVKEGDFREEHGTFLFGNMDPLAEVFVGTLAKWVGFYDDYHEDTTADSYGYKFETGTRPFESVIDGAYMRWNGIGGASAFPIWYDQLGNVTVRNLKLLPSTGTGTGTLYFNNSGTSPTTLSISDSSWNPNLFTISVSGRINYKVDGPAASAGNGFEMGSPQSGFGDLTINNPAPRVLLKESGAAANEKYWAVADSSKTLCLQTLTDLKNTPVNAVCATRGTGTAISYLTIPPRVMFGSVADDGASQLQVQGSVRIGRTNSGGELTDGLRVDRYQGQPYAVFNAFGGAARVIGVGTTGTGTVELSTSDGTTTTDQVVVNSSATTVNNSVALLGGGSSASGSFDFHGATLFSLPRTLFGPPIDDGTSVAQYQGSVRITRLGQGAQATDGLRIDRYQGANQYLFMNYFGGGGRVIGVGSGAQGFVNIGTSDGTTENDTIKVTSSNATITALNVGSTGNPFQVNSVGNVVKLNGATTSFPSANAPGALTNDGAGNLSWGIPKYSLVLGASGWQVNGGTAVAAAAATTQKITLFTAPAKYVITGVTIQPNTACSGAGITTVAASVGNNTTPDLFASAYSIAGAASSSNFQDSAVFKRGSTGSEAIVAQISTTGGNVNALITGCAVDIWVKQDSLQ